MSKDEIDTSGYEKNYSEESFWDKILDCSKAAGATVIMNALELFYSIKDSNTPAWAKTVAIAALGYFICPIDVIPDIIPVLGFSDDAVALAAAIASIAAQITSEHKQQAEEKMKEWFD